MQALQQPLREVLTRKFKGAIKGVNPSQGCFLYRMGTYPAKANIGSDQAWSLRRRVTLQSPFHPSRRLPLQKVIIFIVHIRSRPRAPTLITRH